MERIDYKHLQQHFKPLNTDVDDLIISLTHKTILNEKNMNNTFLKVDYYSALGASVFDFSIINKLYLENSTYSASALTIILRASKHDLLENIIDNLNLKKYMIINDINITLKTVENILYQLFGYLATKNSLKATTEWFNIKLDFSLLSYADDYFNIIRTYFKKEPRFEFIKVEGPDHDCSHAFQMTLDDKSVIETAKTKKDAKKKCSKSFALKFMDPHSIKKYSGIKYKAKKEYLKKYNISSKQHEMFARIARSLSIDYEKVQIAFTHKSATNEYNLVSNSNLRALGAEVEKIFILKYIFHNYDIDNCRTLMRMLGFLHTNYDCYTDVVDKMSVDDICICNQVAKSTEYSLYKVRTDIIKALIYYEFKQNDTRKLLGNISRFYKLIIDEIGIPYLDPTSSLQELVQLYSFLDYKNECIKKNVISAKLEMKIGQAKYYFTGESKSKVGAMNMAAYKALFFLNEGVINWVTGKSNDYNEILVYHFFKEFRAANDIGLVKRYIKDEGFLRLSMEKYQLLDEVKREFYNKLIHILFKQDEIFARDFFDWIFQTLNTRYLILFDKKILLSTVVQDALLSSIKGVKYLYINERVRLEDDSKKEIIKILSENGSIISYLDNKYDEIIMEVIKANVNSIQYVSAPTVDMKNYAVSNRYILNSDVLYHLIDTSQGIVFDQIKREIIQLKHSDKNYLLLSSEIPFEAYLLSLLELEDVIEVYIATGYVFKSGLKVISDKLIGIISNGGDVKIIAGNLKDYLSGRYSNQMDYKTAEYINELITLGIKFYGFAEKFYHGKCYIIKTTSNTYVIHGSTNLSINAFRSNIELDALYCANGLTKEYEKFYSTLRGKSEYIDTLNLELFGNVEIQNSELADQDQIITKNEMNKRISLVPDIDLRNRLNMWLLYSPSNFYDNIYVVQNRYIAIEYNKRGMIVLESFIPGNSYFVFYNETINSIRNLVEGKSKNEIFEESGMKKRGYHVRDLLNLEMKIKSYFLFN